MPTSVSNTNTLVQGRVSTMISISVFFVQNLCISTEFLKKKYNVSGNVCLFIFPHVPLGPP